MPALIFFVILYYIWFLIVVVGDACEEHIFLKILKTRKEIKIALLPFGAWTHMAYKGYKKLPKE